MAIVEIPLDNEDPAFEFFISLDNVPFRFDFKYNTRMRKWFFNIKTETEEDILLGVPVITNWPVIVRFKQDELPLGQIFFVSEETEQRDPLRFDLGTKVKMFYQEAETT